MRDPQRIGHLLMRLQQLWEKDNDLRFFQLIHILQSRYSEENQGVGKITEVGEDGFSRTGYDLFNLEDDQAIRLIEKELEKREQRGQV